MTNPIEDLDAGKWLTEGGPEEIRELRVRTNTGVFAATKYPDRPSIPVTHKPTNSDERTEIGTLSTYKGRVPTNHFNPLASGRVDLAFASNGARSSATLYERDGHLETIEPPLLLRKRVV